MELEFYHEKCVIWHARTHIHGKDCLILSAIGDNKYGRMCYIHLSVIAEILHWEWCSAVLCPGWLMCVSRSLWWINDDDDDDDETAVKAGSQQQTYCDDVEPGQLRSCCFGVMIN